MADASAYENDYPDSGLLQCDRHPPECDRLLKTRALAKRLLWLGFCDRLGSIRDGDVIAQPKASPKPESLAALAKRGILAGMEQSTFRWLEMPKNN